MQAGIAQIEITPPLGIDMTGYIARDGGAIGIHDAIFAKAVVFEQDGEHAALLTCDLLGLHLRFVQAVRAAIATVTAIPADYIMIACSHTHAAPATLFLQDCGEVDPSYMARLHDWLVAVTKRAWENRQPVRLQIGHGHVTTNVHNRRIPGDPIDPDLGVLQISDEQGQPLAIVLNYACHPTCLGGDNRLISAEYPGYVAQKVQAATGAITLFITGAIGDVGPATRGMAALEMIGEAISHEALRVLADNLAAADGQLSVRSQPVHLPLTTPPTVAMWQAELEKWQQTTISPATNLLPAHPKIPIALRNWAQRMLQLAQQDALPTEVISEVQVISLGDLAFVSAPGELFVELGLAIKAQSAQRHVFLCGFGNDDIGYIPTRRAYPYGGYEIDEAYKYYCYPSALAPEAGEQFVATALQLLHEIERTLLH